MSSRPVAEAAGRGVRIAALPNLLTLFRVGLVPVLVVALMRPGVGPRALAAGAFLVACVTDFFDGWLARRRGITTALGQLLDPLADKLIVAAALIMLAAVPPDPRVPVWMAVVIVLREIAVTGLRGIASSEGVLLPAEELGKYKMIFQMFALEALLIHYPVADPVDAAGRRLPRRRHGAPLGGARPLGVVGRRLLRAHPATGATRLSARARVRCRWLTPGGRMLCSALLRA